MCCGSNRRHRSTPNFPSCFWVIWINNPIAFWIKPLKLKVGDSLLDVESCPWVTTIPCRLGAEWLERDPLLSSVNPLIERKQSVSEIPNPKPILSLVSMFQDFSQLNKTQTLVRSRLMTTDACDIQATLPTTSSKDCTTLKAPKHRVWLSSN